MSEKQSLFAVPATVGEKSQKPRGDVKECPHDSRILPTLEVVYRAKDRATGAMIGEVVIATAHPRSSAAGILGYEYLAEPGTNLPIGVIDGEECLVRILTPRKMYLSIPGTGPKPGADQTSQDNLRNLLVLIQRKETAQTDKG